MSEYRTESRRGPVAVPTFERPPKNWMSLEAMTELVGLLRRLADATDEVRVVMLTGGVDGIFIAHADLDDRTKMAKDEARAANAAVSRPD